MPSRDFRIHTDKFFSHRTKEGNVLYQCSYRFFRESKLFLGDSCFVFYLPHRLNFHWLFQIYPQRLAPVNGMSVSACKNNVPEACDLRSRVFHMWLKLVLMIVHTVILRKQRSSFHFANIAVSSSIIIKSFKATIMSTFCI